MTVPLQSEALNLKGTFFLNDTILKEPIFIGDGRVEDSVICSTQVWLSPGKGSEWNPCHAHDHDFCLKWFSLCSTGSNT